MTLANVGFTFVSSCVPMFYLIFFQSHRYRIITGLIPNIFDVKSMYFIYSIIVLISLKDILEVRLNEQVIVRNSMITE